MPRWTSRSPRPSRASEGLHERQFRSHTLFDWHFLRAGYLGHLDLSVHSVGPACTRALRRNADAAYLGYCGVGFFPATGVAGAPAAPTAGGTATGELTPIPAKHKTHKKTKKAHKAQNEENTCQLEADVTVVYSAS